MKRSFLSVSKQTKFFENRPIFRGENEQKPEDPRSPSRGSGQREDHGGVEGFQGNPLQSFKEWIWRKEEERVVLEQEVGQKITFQDCQGRRGRSNCVDPEAGQEVEGGRVHGPEGPQEVGNEVSGPSPSASAYRSSENSAL